MLHRRFINSYYIHFISLFGVVLCFSDLFESFPTVENFIFIGQCDIFICLTMIDYFKHPQSIIVQIRLHSIYCQIVNVKLWSPYLTLKT